MEINLEQVVNVTVCSGKLSLLTSVGAQMISSIHSMG